MHKKIKIFALSAVILTGIEAELMAKGCIYDCVAKFSKDVEDCTTFFSTHEQAVTRTENCVETASSASSKLNFRI